MDYDNALELVGGCGRYQILIFFLMGIVSMKCGVDMQSLVLTTYVPPYSCAQPYNSTDGKKDACHSNSTNETCTAWMFDNSVVDRTMMTEFNLFCDKEGLGKVYMTTAMMAIMVGRLIGLLCDIYGRRKLFIILVGYDLIMTPIQAFVPTLEAQFVVRILRGFGDGVIFTSWIYMMELVGTKHRINIGCNYWILFCLGYASSGLLGNCLRDWRYVQMASCYVLPAYIALCFLMVESPRWLVVKGDKKLAIENLMRMARLNGKKNVSYEKLKEIRVEEDVTPGRITDCFSSRQMTLKTVVMASIMWAVSLAYYGLNLDATFANQNLFINMALMGAIEVPGSVASWIIGDKLGRKSSSICLFLVAGTIILIVPHLPSEGSAFWVRTMIAVFGKFILTTGYCLEAVFVTELQPTCVRNVSMLPSQILASLGGVVAPMVLSLYDEAYWLPSVVIGSMCIFGGLTLLPLPETKDLPLAQTIEEADLLVCGREKEFISRLSELRSRNGKEILLQVDDFPKNIAV